jgi:hypothetical protein
MPSFACKRLSRSTASGCSQRTTCATDRRRIRRSRPDAWLSSISALSRGTIGALAFVVERQPSVCWRPARSGPSKQVVGSRRRGRVALRPATSLMATAWLLLSEVSSPGGAGAAAALAFATQEFVAKRWRAAVTSAPPECSSPGRTGSLGRVGQRGCWRSRPVAPSQAPQTPPRSGGCGSLAVAARTSPSHIGSASRPAVGKPLSSSER